MFAIIINKAIGKRLARLPTSDQKKIYKVLSDLENNPFPENRDLKKMQGASFPIWRIRIGNLRIIYTVLADSKTIKVADIDFRGNVY